MISKNMKISLISKVYYLMVLSQIQVKMQSDWPEAKCTILWCPRIWNPFLIELILNGQFFDSNKIGDFSILFSVSDWLNFQNWSELEIVEIEVPTIFGSDFHGPLDGQVEDNDRSSPWTRPMCKPRCGTQRTLKWPKKAAVETVHVIQTPKWPILRFVIIAWSETVVETPKWSIFSR